MQKYTKVYAFEVMLKIDEGRTVYMLDREHNQVYCFNDISVQRAMSILHQIDNAGRYDFWYTEIEEVEEQ